MGFLVYGYADDVAIIVRGKFLNVDELHSTYIRWMVRRDEVVG